MNHVVVVVVVVVVLVVYAELSVFLLKPQPPW